MTSTPINGNRGMRRAIATFALCGALATPGFVLATALAQASPQPCTSCYVPFSTTPLPVNTTAASPNNPIVSNPSGSSTTFQLPVNTTASPKPPTVGTPSGSGTTFQLPVPHRGN
jgi:hypothetical protein